MHQISDEDLAAARRGEAQAFRMIYESLAPSVLGYLSGRSVDDPEAITQDVFLALFRGLPSFGGGPVELRTLTFSIAHARVVDHIRRSVRSPETIQYDPATDPRRSISAEAAALESLRHSGIVSVLNQLTDDQRDVLLLRIVADLSLEEVSRIMNRSLGATKQLQRRSLIALRSLVQAEQVAQP